MIDFEQVKNEVDLKAFARENLTKSRGGLYCCPACGSGTRGTASSDGALSITKDGKHFECFSCGASGDVFDLAGIVFGIAEDDARGRLQAVAEWAGITSDGGTASRTAAGRPKPQGVEQPADYTAGRERERAYIQRARENITDPAAVSYLQARGFSLEDAQAAGFGYDPQAKRLVIPWRGCDYYHIDRDITGEDTRKYLKPKSADVGAQPLYNPDALSQPAYFIVEGVLDAVAVNLCGYEAVAVASNRISASNASSLAAAVKSMDGGGVAMIMLDNDVHGMQTDKDGNNAALELKRALELSGVACGLTNCGFGAPKDAAEWYQRDREKLREFLNDSYSVAVADARDIREAAYVNALESLRVADPSTIATGIFDMRDFEEPLPTGIAGLDNVLDGGLRYGLYALGAVSSMGKTTLAVQVADYIAEHGRGVLFVTIEQSAREIVAKSLSRLVYTQTGNVATATEITSRTRRGMWSKANEDSLYTACDYYVENIAPNMRIFEGKRQPSVADVETVARMMQEHDGQAPVIIIDYLQLLKPSSERDTDKQATDKNVMSLRQLARDMRTPIIAISSLNRASYSEGVTMDAWKESGAIEYGCDVLLGLQPRGIRETIDRASDGRQRRDADKAIRENKAGYDRACELVVLKNRNGRTPADGIPLTFKTLSALYVEPEPEPEPHLPEHII